MSLFAWLFSKRSASGQPKAPKEGKAAPAKSATAAGPALSPADMKAQRHQRREALYDVVRSVMQRSEVPAAQYKFKVLSLDSHGREFLVMVDLLDAQVLAPERWAPIEQLVAMTAAQRHDVQVKSVYWRLMQTTSARTAPAQGATASAPSPATTAASPAPRPVAASAPTPVSPTSGTPATRKDQFAPIEQDEMMAFKKAVAFAAAAGAAAPGSQPVKSGVRHPRPPSGYQDTQLLDTDDAASPLSRTQFGSLD